MEVLEQAVVKPLKNVMVIDDAYAPADPMDIDGEATTRFKDALLDDVKKLAQVRKRFNRDLNPSIPKHVDDLLQDPKVVVDLWTLRERATWAWLLDTLFRDYADEVAQKHDDLKGLEAFLKTQKWKISKVPRFDPDLVDVSNCQVIFLDFYLKGEVDAEKSLNRAAQLAHLIIKARQEDQLKQYPLVVLMSSRPGAEDQQAPFKEATGLRADFFCFIEKAKIRDHLVPKMRRMLEGYQGKQGWAHVLDEFWLGAIRAATSLRHDLARIEPTELALLQEAELAVEEAKLPDYLSWLVSETLASGLLEDRKVRAAMSAKLPELIGHSAFPGTVPPGSRLADMYVRSVMRLDVTDDIAATVSGAVELGDLFARIDDHGQPTEFLLVIDQTCDLARPDSSQKTSVLCLRSVPQPISDVALAFYRSAGGSGVSDLVGMTVGGVRKYFLAKWDLVNPTTPQLSDLTARKANLRRVARLKPIVALARQEALTQRVGRIGEPVAPPSVMAYRAKLVLVAKDKSLKEFDASKETWASAIVVQGRHFVKPEQSLTTAAPTVAATAPAPAAAAALPAGAAAAAVAAPAPKKKTPPTTTTLSLTSDFNDWLLGKLEKTTIQDAQASSQAGLLKQNLAAGAVQRLNFEGQGLSQKWHKVSMKKPKASIHCVFGKSIPEDMKDAMIVLLLTPYADSV
ncbi:MAG: hypothetical protein HY020_07160 [Burkholderiales bacterium]|nr:hypothetical protein [Burkholderiales bacterium]